jgi:hypothetical protein
MNMPIEVVQIAFSAHFSADEDSNLDSGDHIAQSTYAVIKLPITFRIHVFL